MYELSDGKCFLSACSPVTDYCENDCRQQISLSVQFQKEKSHRRLGVCLIGDHCPHQSNLMLS